MTALAAATWVNLRQDAHGSANYNRLRTSESLGWSPFIVRSRVCLYGRESDSVDVRWNTDPKAPSLRCLS